MYFSKDENNFNALYELSLSLSHSQAKWPLIAQCAVKNGLSTWATQIIKKLSVVRYSSDIYHGYTKNPVSIIVIKHSKWGRLATV